MHNNLWTQWIFFYVTSSEFFFCEMEWPQNLYVVQGDNMSHEEEAVGELVKKCIHIKISQNGVSKTSATS